MSAPGDRLLRQAVETLRRLGYDYRDGSGLLVSIRSVDGHLELAFKGPARGQEGGSMSQGEGKSWKWLSPLGEAIVQTLRGSGWLTAEEIADRIGRSASGEFRGVLRDMVERGILESAQKNGYRLVE